MKGAVFYGEIGVERHMPLLCDREHQLDGDYDRDNPEGTAWGRRNYKETCYLSGMPECSPGEYDRGKPFHTPGLGRVS